MQAMKLFFTILSLCVSVIFFLGCSAKTAEEKEKERGEKISHIVRKAQNLMFENKYLEAIKELEAGNKELGGSSEMYETMGYAFEHIKQYNFAGTYYEKAFEINSGNTNLVLYAGKNYEKGESYDLAIKCYQKYLRLNPKDTMTWKVLARMLESRSLYSEALNTYLEALKNSGRNPTSSEAGDIGLLFLKLKNKVQAKKWLDSAFDATSPENKDVRTKVLVGLIAIYLDDKDVEALAKVVGLLKLVNPEVLKENYPEVEGNIKEFYGKLEEAKKEVASFEAMKKEAAERRQEEERKQEEEAAKKLEEAKAKEKEISLKKTEAEGTEEVVVKEEEVKEESPNEKLVKVSYDKIDKGEAKFAEKVANELILTGGEGNAKYWLLLSKSYEAQGKENEAYFSAREALKCDENDLNLNLFALRTGGKVLNNEKFLDALALAREKFPNNPEIMLGFGRTYVKMKDEKNAKYFYNLFFEYSSKDNPFREEAEEEFAKLLSGQE